MSSFEGKVHEGCIDTPPSHFNLVAGEGKGKSNTVWGDRMLLF